MEKSISIYAQNARLKKRVRRLRELLDECKAEVIALTAPVVLSGVILK